MSEEQNKAILTRFIQEVWNGKQKAVLDEVMADDYLVHYTKVDPGIEGYRRIWDQTFKFFPDIHFNMEDVIAKDDKVVLRYTVTNIPEPYAGIAIYRIRDGLMRECWAPEPQPKIGS
jgi:predicted ester cyclase